MRIQLYNKNRSRIAVCVKILEEEVQFKNTRLIAPLSKGLRYMQGAEVSKAEILLLCGNTSLVVS